MRRLLILLIERLQQRLYNQKDDLKVLEKSYKEIEKALFYGNVSEFCEFYDKVRKEKWTSRLGGTGT